MNCKSLSGWMNASGFMKTLPLSRLGSTIFAGRTTAEKITGTWGELDLSNVNTGISRIKYRYF